MDCLGTQEPHSIGTSKGLLEDPHYQKSTFDQTSRANQQNGCSSNEVSKHIGIAEVHFSRDDSSAAMANLHPILPCDYGSSVPTPTPCCSNPETVFSPNWKQDDPKTKAMYHSGAATDDNSEFLQLIFSDTYKGNSSSELQIWDILDLYFPESFAAVQFNTLMGFGNDDCIPYNECMDDIIEMSISTPSPDKTSNMDDATCGVPVDYTSFYLQNRPSDSDNECSSASSSATGYEYTDNQELPVGLLNLMDINISSQGDSDELSRPSLNTKNIVLVLDLDETLVHSKLQPCDNFDFTLQVFFNMEDHTVYVRQRPHLEMFLQRVAQMFEVVVFTASESVYAEPLLDKLDPERKLISRRFYRESCTFSNGSYMKDLTIFGVDLAKVVIVDNTPQVFQLQVDNGIPIKSWFDDPADVELMELLQFLATLVDAKDVRPIISKNFNSKPQFIGSD